MRAYMGWFPFLNLVDGLFFKRPPKLHTFTNPITRNNSIIKKIYIDI